MYLVVQVLMQQLSKEQGSSVVLFDLEQAVEK
jgi:hypothetical protein